MQSLATVFTKSNLHFLLANLIQLTTSHHTLLRSTCCQCTRHVSVTRVPPVPHFYSVSQYTKLMCPAALLNNVTETELLTNDYL